MMPLMKGFVYAWRGIKEAFKTQINFRFHSISFLIALAASVYFKISYLEWCIVLLCSGMVFMAEMFNTSLEYFTDMTSPEWNDTAGKVKDMAAAAVLISAITALVAGLLIFLPKIF